MKSFLICLLCLLSSSALGQSKTTSEKWAVEMAANVSDYNSLSISIEKTFTDGKWLFGPRVELVNLFNTLSYKGEDSTYQMNAQMRVRLGQIEYQVNNHVRLGIAPFWLLGPLPRNGFYKTPTSVYAHFQLKEGLSLETSFTTSQREFAQLSLRKKL